MEVAVFRAFDFRLSKRLFTHQNSIQSVFLEKIQTTTKFMGNSNSKLIRATRENLQALANAKSIQLLDSASALGEVSVRTKTVLKDHTNWVVAVAVCSISSR